MCGEYAIIDVQAEAHALPFEDNSQDYVISSHVFEHLPDPLAALREWIRVVKDGGIIFMIVPLPGALPQDKGRALATADEWMWASGGITVDSWDYEARPVPGGRRGHYFVYNNATLAALVEGFFGQENATPRLEIIDREAKDTKVGNGHTLVLRVHKPSDRGDLKQKHPGICRGAFVGRVDYTATYNPYPAGYEKEITDNTRGHHLMCLHVSIP